MMKTCALLIVMVLMISACGQRNDDPTRELPTEIGFPTQEQQSEDVTEEITVELPTEPVTVPPEPIEVPVTVTILPTLIPTDTMTPDLTRAAERTATRIIQLTPRIATLTPIPIQENVDIIQIPGVAADIVITEAEFQTQLNLMISNYDRLIAATIDFQVGEVSGIRARTTASGGEAMATGDVFIAFRTSGGLLAVGIVDVNVGSGDPSPGFVDTLESQLQPLIVDVLDALIEMRLGEEHDLEEIVFTESTMQIKLLIPES